MTLTEASEMLGMHYVSTHRLMRQGKLKRSRDGVTSQSVLAYLNQISRPRGYIEGSVAAARLGIPGREMSRVAKARLVKAIPRPGGGWWVSEVDVRHLRERPEKLAILGMKVAPPRGWLTAAQARTMLRCGPSWLSRLARKGLIRRRLYGKINGWYSLADVQAYLQSQVA